MGVPNYLWWRMLLFIFRYLPARLMGSVRLEKVHHSPSAKNVPPARFLYADLRVRHSPFGLLIEITDSPLDYPLFHGGECFCSAMLKLPSRLTGSARENSFPQSL